MGKLKSFKTYTEERTNGIVIAFGNFQPPSIAHEKLFERVSVLASGNKYAIYTYPAYDLVENPISYDKKVKYLRKFFPKHGRNIIEDAAVQCIEDAISKLKDQGYNKISIVCTSIAEARYCKNLNDPIVSVVPFFESNYTEIESQLIECVKNNDLEKFSKQTPKGFGDVQELFNVIRSGMGLKESHNFRKHIQLDPVSEQREAYIQGKLFSVNDVVKITESNEVVTIHECGPNFVIVKNKDNKLQRKWLTAISKIN
jgi:hypothetical protein